MCTKNVQVQIPLPVDVRHSFSHLQLFYLGQVVLPETRSTFTLPDIHLLKTN